MKCNYQLSLTVIAGFAVMLPISMFAQDQNQDQKKHGKKDDQKHQNRNGEQEAVQSAGKSKGGNPHNSARVNNASDGQGHANRVSTESATVQRSSVSAATIQADQPVSRQSTREYSKKQQNQTQAYASQQSSQTRVYSGQQRTQTQVYSNQQYNRNNNYGGLWYPAHTHSDWNQNQHYYWNNHNYQWYNGGWLIIDAGFNPYYTNSGYGSGYGYRGSVVSDVQVRLSRQGYYHGAIDGDIGPGTRHAIAEYQGDHDLLVTGRINDPLLLSLRL